MEPQIRLKNLPQEQVSELLPENLILLGYRGSIAHNMYVPQHDPNSIDDKDLMGVYVAPVQHYLGFGRDEVKEKFINEWALSSWSKVICTLKELMPSSCYQSNAASGPSSA